MSPLSLLDSSGISEGQKVPGATESSCGGKAAAFCVLFMALDHQDLLLWAHSECGSAQNLPFSNECEQSRLAGPQSYLLRRKERWEGVFHPAAFYSRRCLKFLDLCPASPAGPGLQSLSTRSASAAGPAERGAAPSPRPTLGAGSSLLTPVVQVGSWDPSLSARERGSLGGKWNYAMDAGI